MKIFITGATGFVGCHLRKLLASPEHLIWGSTYPDVSESVSEDRLFYMDIRKEKDVSEHLREIKPDWVFHLAAVSNVHHSWNSRKETLETNILGTFNLFESVRAFYPDARILFISSSDIYGTRSRPDDALTEKEDVAAMNPYAYTKWSGEVLSEFYTRVEGLDIVIARPFPHTGPGQSADFVCSDWACQIARIEKGLTDPEIRVGNIHVERDYTDVRDVVRAYVKLMEKGESGEVYNVCSGHSYSLERILECLLSFTSKEISIRVDSRKLRKVDIPRLLGNNSKIKEIISWEPQIPLEQSLRELLEYWRLRV